MLSEVESPEEVIEPNPQGVKDHWWRLIQDEEKRHSDFRDLAESSQNAHDKKASYNLWWPTCEITSASLYSSTPTPEVRRRQRDGDAIQKDAAQVVERSIDFCVDGHDFDGNVQQGIQDMLVAGLGQARVVYNPEFGAVPNMYGEPIETITAQSLQIEHYSWKHFGWQPCKSWERCEWVYFVHMMPRKKVQDDYGVRASEDFKDDDDEKHVKVYEIYHKPSKAIIVISEQFDTPLEVREDELGLSEFFPCPQPMLTNLKTDKLIPAADFKYVEKQIKQLDITSTRISAMTRASKAVRFYDAHFAELAKIKVSKDGDYIPVEDLIDKLSGANLDNVLAEVPIVHNVNVIEMLVSNKDYLKQEVYEILGIADIMRGESNAQEGVQTQQLKAEFGAVRIRDKQSDVNRFCRDLFRIMGEIIAEHFEPDVLQKITGVEITEEVMAVLRDDMLRNVSIDIETDSTNAGDKMRKRQAANDSLESLISGMGQILPGIQSGVIDKSLGQELLLLLVRSVDGNNGNLEDIISQMGDQNTPEAMIQQLQQQLMQMQQQNQAMQQELQKVEQSKVYKDQTQGQLNEARAQETMSKIPVNQTEAMQNTVETDGKRAETAANIAVGITGREPFIRGVE